MGSLISLNRLSILIAVLFAVVVVAGVAYAQDQPTVPVVETVAVTSDPGDDGGYAIGDVIEIGLTFSEEIRATGNPQITLDIGGAPKTATYSGAGTRQLLFSYTVKEGVEDTDGFGVVADSLDRNGGTIQSVDDSTGAALGHPALDAGEGHVVDGVIPEVEVILPEAEFVDPERLMNVVLVFTEPVFNPDLDDIVVTNGTAHDIVPTFPYDGHARFSVWDFLVEPHGEGPVTVAVPEDFATDAFGNGNDQSRTVTKIAATPVDVEVALSTSGFAEGGAAEFVLSRSRDNGEILVNVSVDDSGDFASGTVEIARASDPDNPLEAAFEETPATVGVTFEAGELSKRIRVLTDDDLLDEPDGSVTVRVVDDSQYKYVPGWSRSATSDVRDNDEPVEVGISWIPNHFVDEVIEGNAGLFVLARTSDSGEMTVYGRVTQVGDFLDTATEIGVEFLEDGRFRATFQPGALTRAFYVSTRENAIQEEDGSITLELVAQDGAGYTVDTDEASATAGVVDDDHPPTVTIAADSESTAEGRQAVFTLTRSSGYRESQGNPVTVDLAVSQQGSFLAESGDLGPDTPGPVTVQVTFPVFTYTTKLRLDTLDDDVSENAGEISVTVAPAPGGAYLVGDDSTASTTIVDNEPPTVTVTPASPEVTEGEDVVFRFARMGATDSRITVGVYVGGHQKIMTPETEAIVLNSETPGQVVDARVVFEAGETEAELRLTTQGDNKNEGDGYLGVRIFLNPRASFRFEDPGYAEVLVRDDDVPTVSVVMPTLPTGMTLSEDGTTWEGTMYEGEEIGFGIACTGDFTFTESYPNELRHLFPWFEEMNHPARYTPSADILGNNTVFYGGSISNCGDSQDEYRGERRHRYTGPDGGEIRISMVESNVPFPAVFREAEQQAQEAQEEAMRLGTREPLQQPGVFLDDSGAPRRFCEDELRFCPRYEVGTPNAIKIKVLNRIPAILIKAESQQVNEGEPARFILERLWNADNLSDTRPGWGDTRVLLTTSAEGHYTTGTLPTEIVFSQGETRKVIEITTVDDSAFAPDGSVTIEVLEDTTGPDDNIAAKYQESQTWVGHTPEGGRSDLATVTIRNDDNQPGILITDATVSEAGGSMEFDVTLNRAWFPEVTVDWATSDGTATAGSDYTAAGGTIIFPSGDTFTGRTITVPITNDEDYEEDETFTITLSAPVGAGFPGGGTTATATGTIEDDDVRTLPEVNIFKSDDTTPIWQEGAFVRVRLSRAEHDSDAEWAVDFHVGDVNSEDREVVNVVFQSGSTSVTKRFRLPDDELENGRRQIAAELHGDSGPGGGPDQVWRPGPNWRTVFEVEDDDGLPRVSVVAGQLWVEEGEDAVFLLTRDTGLDDELTVTVYRRRPGPRRTFTATFGEGEATIEVVTPRDGEGTDGGNPEHNYTTHDDSAVNDPSHREVRVRLLGDNSGEGDVDQVWTAGDPPFASVWVYDNDPQHILVLEAEVASGGPANPVLPGETATVLFDVTNFGREPTGDAVVVSNDLAGLGSCQLGQIASGVTSRCTATFTPSVSGTFEVEATATDAETSTTSNTVTFTIVVEDPPPTVGFEQTSLAITEGSIADSAEVSADLTVELSEAATETVTVDYAMSPFSSRPAIPGEDYVEEFGTLTFTPAETTATIQVTVLNDNVDEDRERFRVLLTNPTHATLEPGKDIATVRITNYADTPKPVASLYFNHDGPVPESEGRAEFLVRLDGPSGKTVDVDTFITVPPQGTATIGTDYEDPGVKSLYIPPGETEATFSIVIVNDDEKEEDETFAVGITRGNYGLVDNNAWIATATIADDDDILPTAIILSAVPDEVQEGEDVTVTVTAELDADPLDTDPLGADVTIEVSVDDNPQDTNAADRSDFDAVAPFEITISAGDTSGSQTFQLATQDDDQDEPDETIVLQGAIATESEAAAGDLPVTPATLTITDNDTRGVTIDPLMIELDEGGPSKSYTVVLDSSPTDTVTVTISHSRTPGLQINPTELEFTRTDWNRPQSVTVLATEDGDAAVNLSSADISHQVAGGDYGSETAPDVTVVITDTTVPEITVTAARASEGDGELAFLVTLNLSFGRFVDVQYELVDGTAEAGSDYTRPEGGAQTLRFEAGQTEKTIRVPVSDDSLDEPAEETLILRLTDISDEADLPGGADTLDVQGVIEDDDPTPVVSVAGPGGFLSFVSESVGTITFTITLAGSSAEVVSVDYSTGSSISRALGFVDAVEDEDYTGVEGTVEFQPGETSKTVTVDVTNDNLSETVEYFPFNIANPRNAHLRYTAAGAVILDNDRKGLVMTPIALTIEEGDSTGDAYTVRLASEPTDDVTVTLGGFADTDLRLDKTSLIFTDTTWNIDQTVNVTAREDDDAVNDTVTLTHTVGGGDYDRLRADSVTVTVTDNDTAGLVLSEPALTIPEGGSAVYTVKLASEPTATVEVRLSRPIDADLSTEPQRLIFTVGNWNQEQQVEVTALPDDDATDDLIVITHMPNGGDYGPELQRRSVNHAPRPGHPGSEYLSANADDG